MEPSRKVRLVVILAGVAVGILTVGSPPWPKVAVPRHAIARADEGCSLSTLRGSYAVQGQGTIVAQLPNLPPPPFPEAETSIASFDGAGHFSGKGTLNFNGEVAPVTFTGTYTVGSDCTGTLTLESSLGVAVHESLVVLGNQGFRSVETDPFIVITHREEKIGD